MAFVAAATSVGAAVLGTGAAAGIGSTLVGGALIGAGVGGAYSALTGDGNVLNSMLTGGLLGAGGAGLGSAMGIGSAAGSSGLTPAAAASMPSTAAVPTANVATVTPAMQAAALDAAAVAEGSTVAGMVPAANTGLPAATSLPPGAVNQVAKTGLTNKEMLGYGLAGSAALSLLGARNQPSLSNVSTNAGEIRPYTYSQTINPNYGMPGEPYYIQSYTAQEPYPAKAGGLMKLAYGGPVESMSARDQQMGMYPQGMVEKTYYATPSQRPASMEVIKSDYDTPVNPMTGLGRQFAGGGAVRYADGGQAQVPQGLAAIQNTPIPRVDVVPMAAPTTAYTLPAPVQNPSVAAYNQILADRAANEYVAQAPLLSMLPGGGERANAADTSKIINEMYLKNLGRQGEQAGLDYWTQRKMNTGESLADINKEIRATPEGQLNRLYTETLGRRPDIEGLSYWNQQLQSGVPIADIRKQFEASPEYLARQKETPTAKKEQTGLRYDPATQRFSGSLSAPQQTGLAGIDLNDPNFLAFLQNQYTQYQQSQQGGGAKAGGLMPAALRNGGMAEYNLGSYSDGGRLLKGPGDGMSDNIPATIGKKQPARLADGEFVVPADVVSHLGNGSTDAGAKRLYSMMDKVRKARTGNKKQGKEIKAEKFIPV